MQGPLNAMHGPVHPAKHSTTAEAALAGCKAGAHRGRLCLELPPNSVKYLRHVVIGLPGVRLELFEQLCLFVLICCRTGLRCTAPPGYALCDSHVVHGYTGAVSDM